MVSLGTGFPKSYSTSGADIILIGKEGKMAVQAQVQYVSDAEGNAVGVIVPIELWRKIESQRETVYLLKSETMKKRLLEAWTEPKASLLRKRVRNLEFDLAAFEDLAWWVQHDEHRLVYQVTNEKIRILACRYHY